MEATGRQRILGQRNRLAVRRRLNFSNTRGIFPRRDVFPLIPTPHIENAADYFREVNNEADGFANESRVEAILIPARSHPPPVVQGLKRNHPKARRRRHRRAFVSPGKPSRPNLKRSLKIGKEFVNKAEKEASEVLSNRICGSTKKFTLNVLIQKGQELHCSLARASQNKTLSQGEVRLVQQLQNVNLHLEEITKNFEEELERYRKTARLDRGRNSRKRVCCYFCTQHNV